MMRVSIAFVAAMALAVACARDVGRNDSAAGTVGATSTPATATPAPSPTAAAATLTDGNVLADMNGAVAKLYGAWNDAIGVAERVTVVVDKAGIVEHVEHNGVAQGRDQKQALAAIH